MTGPDNLRWPEKKRYALPAIEMKKYVSILAKFLKTD
jgi:hypothetical protein